MSQYTTAGKITMASLRNLIIAKQADKGDSVIINATDYAHLTEEVTHAEEPVSLPLSILGVLIVKDTTNEVPASKVQFVQDDKM